MVKVNLLRSIPKSNRKVKNRLDKKNKSVIKISKKFGAKYFDGERKYGYGGYKYDGRWQGVAKDIIKHFNLKKGSKVLDVGCAKGYLVRDLLDQGIDAYGIDISRYALENADKKVKNRLFYGNAKKINFKNNFFDAAISINCITLVSEPVSPPAAIPLVGDDIALLPFVAAIMSPKSVALPVEAIVI